jgi:hypothetical protein
MNVDIRKYNIYKRWVRCLAGQDHALDPHPMMDAGLLKNVEGHLKRKRENVMSKMSRRLLVYYQLFGHIANGVVNSRTKKRKKKVLRGFKKHSSLL